MIDPTLEPPCRLVSEKYRVRGWYPAQIFITIQDLRPAGRRVGLPYLAEVLIQLLYNCLLLNVRFYISTGAGPPHLTPFLPYRCAKIRHGLSIFPVSTRHPSIFKFTGEAHAAGPCCRGSGRLVYCGLGKIH